jgi:Na+/proline symporter/signal transduction histidine kinase
MQNINLVDVFIIFLYLLVCLLIGLKKFKSIKTIKHYTLGFYPVNTTVLVTSIFATYFGAGSTIGAVGMLSLGLVCSIPMVFEVFSWFITARIFGRNIDKFRGYISLSEIMDYLYGASAGWITSIVSLIQAIGGVTVQVTATGYIFYYFLNIPHTIGIVLGFGILMSYSIFGGIRSITLTDVFQCIILYIAIPCACAFIYQNSIEPTNVITIKPSISFAEINLLLFLSMIFDAMVPHAEPTFIQRYLMSTNRESLERSLYIIALISIPFIAILCFIGFIAHTRVPSNIPGDSVFLYLISHYIPVGVKGIIVSGLLAVVMSTADSWLNNSAIISAHDIGKKLFKNLSDKQEVLIARIATFIISMIAVFLSIKGQDLLKMVWLVDNLWQPLLLIPITAGFLGFDTNKESFFAATTLAIISTLIGAIIAGEFSTLSLSFGIIGSAVGLFGMHYWQKHHKYLVTSVINIKLRNTIPLTFDAIIKFTHTRINKYKPQYYAFSTLIILSYLIPLLLSLLFTPHPISISSLSLYVTASVMCLLLLFQEYWPQQLRKKYLSLYWHITLLFCLPVVSSYLLLANSNHEFCIVSFILSLFLLYLLTDLSGFIILSALGVIFGCIGFYFINSSYENEAYVSGSFYTIKCIYDFLAIIILMTWNYKERIHQEKLEPMRLLGAAIAHELRTPLSIITMQANNMDCNIDSGETIETRNTILDSVRKGQYFIDSVLMNLRDAPTDHAVEEVTISKCIKEAISNFPFIQGQKDIISVNINEDFVFKGNKLFVIHVISNLLNNAIYYTKQVEDPLIQITVTIKTGQKLLTILDNGTGMDKQTLHNLFTPFYTKRKAGGIGIGLAFCKMVIEGLGGRIGCKSEEGKFTEFNLIFP